MLRSLLIGGFCAVASGHILQRREDDDTCVAKCTAQQYGNQALIWKPMTVTGTVVGGTVVVSIDTDAHKTVTSTHLAIPSGYSLPPTNADGTHIGSATITVDGKKKLTTLAFPTGHILYASEYKLVGTLSTDGECTTIESPGIQIPYGTKYSWSGPQSLTTMPPETDFMYGPDPEGLLWTLAAGAASGYGPRPSKDGASVCSNVVLAPVGIQETAQMVLHTMTITGGSGESSTRSAYRPPTAAAAALSSSIVIAKATASPSSTSAETTTLSSTTSSTTPQAVVSSSATRLFSLRSCINLLPISFVLYILSL